MRVIYFSRSYTTHDRRFLVELANSPHEVWYLRLEDDPVCYEKRSVPSNIHVLPPLAEAESANTPESWIRLAPRLEGLIDRINPDLIHAGPVQSCAFLAALTGFRPLLAMSWGSDILVDGHRDEFWMWLTRRALKHAEMLVTDCGEVSDEACRIANLDRRNVVQFPWGVDISTFRPPREDDIDSLGWRRQAGWENSPIVLSTRSWEPIYGVVHLVDAFALALKKEPRLRLVLAGNGSEAVKIEQRIRDAGI